MKLGILRNDVGFASGTCVVRRAIYLVIAVAAWLGCSVHALADGGFGSSSRQDGGALTLASVNVQGIRPPSRPEVPYLGQSSYAMERGPTWYFLGPLLVENEGDKAGGDARSGCESGYEEQTLSGNPVVLGTGNKVEFDVDFAMPGEMGLFLKRGYNKALGGELGLFGHGWISNFDIKLIFVSSAPQGEIECVPGPGKPQCGHAYRPIRIYSRRPDGRKIKFYDFGGAAYVEDKASPIATISGNIVDGWVLRREDNAIERYTSGGLIQSLKNKQGIGWDFSYGGKNGTQLQSVAHTGGRIVKFGWSGDLLTAVTDPAGSLFKYEYVPVSSTNAALSAAILPGAPETRTTYHYDAFGASQSMLLSGKSFNGVRYSHFAYDDRLRANRTEHAGGIERYQFSYETVGEDGLRVTEINPLGKQTVHEYKKGKLQSVTGIGSASCQATYKARTYDRYGYDDRVNDFSGNVIDFDHDAHGHLVRQVEGVGTPVAREVTYAWDEAGNRITRMTVVGDSETRYTYTANGRIETITVIDLSANPTSGQALTTTYRYATHANGMLATTTVDGPLPDDTVTYTYNPQGDLTGVKNALGHTTTYEAYNALGQPGRVISPTGAVVEAVYDARGRVMVERAFPNGSPVEKRYTYGASGLLDTVTTTDGNAVLYHYDAARRLIQEDLTEPDGGYAVKRYTYNAMSQPIKVEIGRDR